MAKMKNPPKDPAIAVFRLMTKMLSNMSADELLDLAAGRSHLAVVKTESRGYEQIGLRMDAAVDFLEIENKLRLADSTSSGFSILDEAKLTKAELERMARTLDLPITRQDSISRLEEKIVESLVGSRLNSRAVRGR